MAAHNTALTCRKKQLSGFELKQRGMCTDVILWMTFDFLCWHLNTFKHFLDKQNSFIHQHADALYVLQLI